MFYLKYPVRIFLFIILLFYCSYCFGKTSTDNKYCDAQIQVLDKWLDSFMNYCRVVLCGVQPNIKQLIEIDEELPILDRFLHSLSIYEDCVVDYEYTVFQSSVVSHSVENSIKKLIEKVKNDDNKLEKFLSANRKQKHPQFNLHISLNAPWKLVVQTIQGFVKASILDIYFVFGSSRELVARPPSTPFQQRLSAMKKHAEEIVKPNERMIVIAEDVAKYLKGCHQIQEIFAKIDSMIGFEKVSALKTHLPTAMKTCGCNPTLSQIQAVVWYVLWVGKVRVGKLIHIAMPETKDCHEVIQDGNLPWKEAYKAVIKATKNNANKPLCFKVRSSE